MAQDDGPAPEDWPAAAGASGAPLQASEQQFQREFGSLPCGMIVISLDAGQPGRCLAVNDAFCQLTGYSRGSWPARTSSVTSIPKISPRSTP